MRASIVASLILLALLGMGLRGWIDEAGPPSALAEESTSQPTTAKLDKPAPLWERQVVGNPHSKPEDAMDDALNQASETFARHMKQKHPGMAWTPSPEFVRKHLVKGEPRAEPTTVGNSGELYQVRLNLELNSEGQKEVEIEAREFLVHQRMLLLGRGVGMLVLVLGGIAAFIRVNDWTKGYLTFPLRLLTIALAAAGIFAIWWLV
jgi:hypothetical protein